MTFVSFPARITITDVPGRNRTSTRTGGWDKWFRPAARRTVSYPKECARSYPKECARQAPRKAFTLLEILLVFGLLVVLLGALAMAIDLHLRVSHLGRQRVEEAQLARVLLQRIAEDIRGAVPPESMDAQSLAKTLITLLRDSAGNLDLGSLAGLSESNTTGSGRSSSGSGTGSTSGESTSSTATGTTEGEEEETSETILGVPRSVPGLYGGPDWLQVDVSRLPRVEEYDLAFTSSNSATNWEWNQLSEVKMVLYGLMIPGSTMSISQTRLTPEGWGLYRDEVDRAVGALASEQNVLDQKVRAVGPIAPEVVWLEFWYFDGTQWYDSWDSEAQGGLPVAVEIVLGLDMSRSLSWRQATAEGSLEEIIVEPRTLYRLVVYLPSARPTPSSSTESEDTTESQGTASTE